MKKLTKKQLCNHIKKNSEDTYSMAVELSAIYFKLYGELPRGIGLSGAQAEFAKQFVHRLPNGWIDPKVVKDVRKKTLSDVIDEEVEILGG